MVEMEVNQGSAKGKNVQKATAKVEMEKVEKTTTAKVEMVRIMEKRGARKVRKIARNRAAVVRALNCCLTLFTTSSGASTWRWNRHLKSVSKTSSITETNRARCLQENGQE